MPGYSLLELSRYSYFTLQEINLYPYLAWAFYIILLVLTPFLFQRPRLLFILFLASLPFEAGLLLDVGFFIRPSYVLGMLFIIKTFFCGIHFPRRAVLIIGAFFGFALLSLLLNLDLIGRFVGMETRATVYRPLLQLGQLSTMLLVMVSVYTLLKRDTLFPQAVRVMHWVSVTVALYAIWEVTAIYLHLPYLNLNNHLPEFWYIKFGIPNGPLIFRPRVTFIEPIELNNFLLFGITCSLIYRLVYNRRGWRYWLTLAVQLIPLFGAFSRSTLLTLFVLVPVFTFFYPRTGARGPVKFFTRQSVRMTTVVLFMFILFRAFTLTPEAYESVGTVSSILYSRFARFHSISIGAELSILGRTGALEEAQLLARDGRIWFGVGPGNEVSWWGGTGSFYSLYSQLVMNFGLVGLTIFLFFVGQVLSRLLINAWRRNWDIHGRQAQWIFFIGLSAILVQRLAFPGLLTDTYFWVALAFAMYVGHYPVRRSIALPERKTLHAQTHEVFPSPVVLP